MICAMHTISQEVEQYGTIALSESQSINCNAQLRGNRINIHFPGVYIVQWSVIGKLQAAGKFKIQAYNMDTPIVGSYASDKSPANVIRTLTSAPVYVVFSKPGELVSISLRNMGSTVVLSNVVLSVQKVF